MCKLLSKDFALSVTNYFHVCTIFTQMMRVDNKNATKEFFVEFRMQVCKFDWQEEWKKVADNLFKLGTSLNVLWIFFPVRRMHNV